MKVTLALLLIVAIISGSSSLKCNLFGDWQEIKKADGSIVDEVNEKKDMETCSDGSSCMNMQGSAGNNNIKFVVKDLGSCIQTNLCTELNGFTASDKAKTMYTPMNMFKERPRPRQLVDDSEDPIKIQCCETEGCNKMKNSQENSSGKK